MVIMDIKLDNFYGFNGFHMNLSYPKKIVHSSIEDEHLLGNPNFRYRKVNILMGSNAAGKTTLGKVLMNIFNYLRRNQLSDLSRSISNHSKQANFTIDFVPNGVELYRIVGVFTPSQEMVEEIQNIDLRIYKTKISKTDNYERCAKRLNTMNGSTLSVREIPRFGWYFTYPKDDFYYHDVDAVEGMDKSLYLRILNVVLKTLDSAITDIVEVPDVEDAYIISRGKQKLVMQEESFAISNVLSSGTIAAVDVSKLICSMVEHRNGFYYCDEKFSYIHSDIEKMLLSVMISKLGRNEQFFFTTHNLEIADMNLPKHTFHFLKKRFDGEESYIECIQASDYLKKSTDSLKLAIENDVFGTSPDVSLLNELYDLSR